MDRKTWTVTMIAAAKETAKLIGVSAEAIVAQAALESAWGASAIGFNLFGIKAGSSWAGKKKLVTTQEVINGERVTIQDWFRDYNSYEDSIKDHFQFLRDNSRYANIFDPKQNTSDETYFRLLQKDGYATDPNYANSLMNMLASVKSVAGVPDQTVVEIQRILHITPADGIYGPETKAAVMGFQKSHGLEPDGIVGPKTIEALKASRGLVSQVLSTFGL